MNGKRMIFALLLALRASADIAPNPIFSETVRPIGPTSVRMADERVTVDLYKDFAKVRIEFTMKNPGEETTLEVGFPNIPAHRNEAAITNFTARVDGVLQPVAARSIPELNEKRSQYDPGKYLDWHVWDMTFRQGETQTVEVSYEQPYGPFYTSGLLWRRYFSYILETGAGWAGTIGKADIVVNLKNLTSEHVVEVHPPGYVMTSNRITWALSDLEPTEKDNIRIVYNTHKNHAAYVEHHLENHPPKDWNDEWIIAYACNRAGDHEAAARHAEHGLTLEVPEKRRSYRRQIDPINARVALLTQLTKARYHLYRKNRSIEALKQLDDVLNELAVYTAQVIAPPENLGTLFSTETMEDPVKGWLFRDFNDEGPLSPWRWKEHAEATLKGIPYIQLVEQRVEMDLHQDQCDVLTTLSLINLGTERSIEFQLSDISGHYTNSDAFTNVSITVDGIALPVEGKPATNAPSAPRWNPTWRVNFSEKKPKTIALKYRMPTATTFAYGKSLMESHRFYYLLGNGAFWRGRVERGTMVLNLNDVTLENRRLAFGAEYSEKDNTLTWEFEDWDPGETGLIQAYFSRYKDLADYIERKKDADMSQWTDRWKLAYAYNKSGQHEQAARVVEAGLPRPGPASDADLAPYPQITLRKQLVMARYQLYLEDESDANLLELRNALEGLKEHASRAADGASMDHVFPDGDYKDPAYQWLLEEFLVDHDNMLGMDENIFKNHWNRKIRKLTRPGNVDRQTNRPRGALHTAETTNVLVVEQSRIIQANRAGEPAVLLDHSGYAGTTRGAMYVRQGSEIMVYDAKGKRQRSISIPSQVRSSNFVVLPDKRIAFLDNGNDVIFLADRNGRRLRTIAICDEPDRELRMINGVVVGTRLIVLEDGRKEVLAVDLDTLDVSVFRSLKHLRGWIGSIAHCDGVFYISQHRNIYSFSERSKSVRKVATTPEGNITGLVAAHGRLYAAVNGMSKIKVRSLEEKRRTQDGSLYEIDPKSGKVTEIQSALNYPQGLLLLKMEEG